LGACCAAPHKGCRSDIADTGFTVSTLRAWLVASVAGGAVLAGVGASHAAGLTFTWGGSANGTSYASAGNWLPQNSINGPPTNTDSMILTSGTPLVSTLGKHVVNADISGGTLTIQNAAAQLATYYVDGTLHLSGTGTLDITTGTYGANVLAAGRVTMDGGSMTGGGTLNVSGAPRPALPAGPAMTQSGGDIDGLTINTPDYTMSGGTLDASTVNFANTFTLTGSGEVKSTAALNGGAGSTMSQSGGQMDGVVTGLDTYTQSGGDLGGSVTTGTYSYTDAAATSDAGATINASQSFLLSPASGAGVVTANLTGSGSLVKSGDGAVALAGTNDFTGSVAINAGTLELRGGNALADSSAVSLANVADTGLLVTDSETIGSLSGGGTTGGNLDIADGATLTIAGTGGTAFAGNIDGNATGALVKAGTGALTLSGALSLNALTVDGGTVRILTAGSLGAVTIGDVAGATLAMNQSETIASLSGGGANGGSVTISKGKFLTVGDSSSTTYLGSLTGSDNSKLIKQGSGTLTLGGTVAMNTVAVNAGTLELSGAATLGVVTVANTPGATLLLSQSETIASLLGGGADGGTVTIADGKTLTVGDATSTTFLGTMGGETGDLVKQGAGTLTLGGAVTLGDLAVTGGTLQIGTGTSTETASFESADISAGATVYVAANATLTIRVPNNIVNNGHLTNDGTVNDDLANASTFDNNHAYNADVASNTGTINNNTPGVWTGDVLTNAATINNNSGAEWDGDVKGNMGLIRNLAGATWSGHVLATGRHMTAGEIDNYGTWTDGTVEGNSTVIFNYDGSWTGDILGNIYLIVNNINDDTANPAGVNAAQWTGAIKGNSRDGVIINDIGGIWTGGVTGNMGEIHNRGTWDDGTITGNGSYLAEALQLPNGYIVNEATGTWNGDIDDNYGSIGNLGGTWNGNVLGNSGGTISNDNAPDETGTGYWIGDIEGNVGGILNGGGGDWTGKVLANSGYIRNDILGV
jgi:autotransporter-associated beta strand protein